MKENKKVRLLLKRRNVIEYIDKSYIIDQVGIESYIIGQVGSVF